jgi:hypothetical protein
MGGVAVTDQEIETEARALLRETIRRSAWYPNLQGAKRNERIEQDVDLHWRLMWDDAVKRLEQRNRAIGKAGDGTQEIIQ